jgi:hypothetical protein
VFGFHVALQATAEWKHVRHGKKCTAFSVFIVVLCVFAVFAVEFDVPLTELRVCAVADTAFVVDSICVLSVPCLVLSQKV